MASKLSMYQWGLLLIPDADVFDSWIMDVPLLAMRAL